MGNKKRNHCGGESGPVSIRDVLDHVQGVVSRVIKTESPTQDNELDRLSFLDDVSSDVAGTGETSTLTL